MANIRAVDRIEVSKVLQLTDDQAIQWLEDNPYDNEDTIFSTSSKEIHKIVSYAFSRRESKRLRLAVAQYGSHIYTSQKIYKNGSRIERLAILSNSLIGPMNDRQIFSPDGILNYQNANQLLINFQTNPRELEVLANNPHINREWVAGSIKRLSDTNENTDEILLYLIHYLVNNPIVNARRDDTFMDGWAEHSYNKLNLALANLLQTVPVTIEWAAVLGRLLETLYLDYVPDFEVDLIDRWKGPESENDYERISFDILREQITIKLIASNHRSEVKDKYTIDHDDLAVRKGLYRSLYPHELFKNSYGRYEFNYTSFKYPDDDKLNESQKTFLEVFNKCVERDKNEFIESLIGNDKFWESSEDRKFLEDIAWHADESSGSSLDVPNFYRAREQYYQENYPTYFEENSDDPYEESIEDKITDLQEVITNLKIQIESNNPEDFAQEQRDYIDNFIYEAQNQISGISNSVNSNAEVLSREISQGTLVLQLNGLNARLKQQSIMIWVLIVVIGFLAYLNM